ncbi:hypothetical protein FQN54_002810 [Arachnomyces sp. PD_36]|nr:hypothetical protein FQN54_002810 [Arachnomyces sp. PD_36]
MIPRAPYLILSTIFLFLIPITIASTPTSFCKCTCFSNSTIIQLGPPDSKTTTSPVDYNGLYGRGFEDDGVNDDDLSALTKRAGSKEDKKYRALNCNDCNRQFCLDYHLPKCKGAKESDVYTTCFREF